MGEWKKGYLDMMLVPLGILIPMLYHCWLWRLVRSQPHRTTIGINSAGCRLWVLAITKDSDKKNILAVQTLRNAIMGSTLMATASVLLSSGLAAVISSTYTIKKPVNDSVFGAHGEFMVSLKYVTVLLIFLFAFLCYSLSIRFINQVNFLINVPQAAAAAAGASAGSDECRALLRTSTAVTPEYICGLMEKGCALNTLGNRLFYGAIPLLLWIFGPVLVFLSSLAMVVILYNVDVVQGEVEGGDICNKVENLEHGNDCMGAV